MTTSTGDVIITYTPSKKDIIQRLFEAGHINFNEMWTLLVGDEEAKYVPLGVPEIIPNPIYPWDGPQYTTDVKDNERLHIPGRRTGDPESH